MPIQPPRCFAAIDFETADCERDSACSVAIVKVVGEEIVSRWVRLIRPPRKQFVFTYLHGIGWKDVENQPTFGELWPEFEGQISNVQFLVAHNAGFDKAVMTTCCTMAGIKPPRLPFHCTMQAARMTWGLYPTKLPNVCRFLNIPLEHHKAESDAEACALIYVAAQRMEKPKRIPRTRAI
jgi:DNA polymerase III subunit epsilon